MIELISILAFWIVISALVLWWVFRKPKPKRLIAKPIVTFGQPYTSHQHPVSGYVYAPTTTVDVIQVDSGFTDGMVIGMATQVVSDAATAQQCETPAFHSFGKGDSDGGGASSNWGAPSSSDTCSSDSSSYDSGSNCDSVSGF
jgi:hypothetical protein